MASTDTCSHLYVVRVVCEGHGPRWRCVDCGAPFRPADDKDMMQTERGSTKDNPDGVAEAIKRLACNTKIPWRARLLCAGALMIEVLPADLWRGIKLDDGDGWVVPIDQNGEAGCVHPREESTPKRDHRGGEGES